MKTKKNHYQIVIVGGGLVGATLAIALDAIGIDLVVIEAFQERSNSQPSFDDRSVALSLSSLKIYQRLGLTQMINSAEPIKNIHISDQGRYGFSRLECSKLNQPQLGAVIENKILGLALMSEVRERGIEYCCPAKVVSAKKIVKNDKNVMQIELEGIKQFINCDLLILAEGSRSNLKSQLGYQTEVTDFKKSALVCNITTQIPHKNWAYERFTNNGPLALLPLSDNRMSIVWSNTSEKSKELHEMSKISFAKELEVAFGSRLGRVKKIGKRNVFPLMQLVTSKIVSDQCLLIGNTAQQLHPIAGQGLNLALRDIEALRKKIQKLCLDKESKLDSKNWLDEFENERMSDRFETIEATEALARLFSNPSTALSLSRNLLMKIMDVTPAIKEVFAMKAMGFKA
ncbi:2-octaprenyl-6-methoxyphenyl hydroxylase [Kangiella sp. HZ709]|uniref:2-octaprenyl-6-methoxyphenyl hydroxylase n=1 Tax=Kangiella sp. HZ709 TaxID=2666328 RepID=UPI0012B02AE9|nr:2-octaprenyl-6-methoxyphenyl hydroxylase [Kangiella sp. HZ709]MRX28074.1 2-octaprenyl-6-methoxyphenyl hydroxylase [Kangiella sp. HZ709]